MKLHIYALQFLLLFGCYSAIYSQNKEIILETGNPPLTQSMVQKSILFLEWALDLRLSTEQTSQFQQILRRSWKNNNKQEINSTLELITVHEQLLQLNEAERNKAKEKLRAVLLENIQRDPDDELARILIAASKASGDNIQKTPATDKAISTTAVKNKLRVGTDGFTGIYRMLRPKALNINNTGYESGYYIEHITFLPGGKLYWSLPPEGLLYFDPVIAERSDPEDWGSYELKGSEIHVLRGPEKKKYIITRNGERLNNPPSLGKGSFRPIPHCDGLKLEGNYRRHETEPTITFTKDGRFQDGGIFRYFGTIGKLDGTAYQDDGVPGTGTYLIEQNTLELLYTDGRIKRFVFEAFPENLATKPAVTSFLVYEQRLERY